MQNLGIGIRCEKPKSIIPNFRIISFVDESYINQKEKRAYNMAK
jgi:hypothetical protein